MIAGAIIACLAQRLVRKLCQKCKKPVKATPEDCKLLAVGPDDKPIDPANPPTIYHPGGCPECNNTGYKGRIACVEIFYLDEELDELIASGANKIQLRANARKKGFRSMLDDGILKIYEGWVSLSSRPSRSSTLPIACKIEGTKPANDTSAWFASIIVVIISG